jgi:hypothetical protein
VTRRSTTARPAISSPRRNQRSRWRVGDLLLPLDARSAPAHKPADEAVGAGPGLEVRVVHQLFDATGRGQPLQWCTASTLPRKSYSSWIHAARDWESMYDFLKAMEREWAWRKIIHLGNSYSTETSEMSVDLDGDSIGAGNTWSRNWPWLPKGS